MKITSTRVAIPFLAASFIGGGVAYSYNRTNINPKTQMAAIQALHDSANLPKCLFKKVINYVGPVKEKCTLISLFKKNYPNDYWIPEKWPKLIHQVGPTCGLLALEISLDYSGGINPPKYRKLGNMNIESIREVAKKNGFTNGGEIFEVQYLHNLASHFGFGNGEFLTLDSDVNMDEYVNAICGKLKSGKSVVVACEYSADNKPGNFKPGIAYGYKTHWTTIFGFYKQNDECYFLVSNANAYAVWAARDLYDSNKHMPVNNNPEQLYYGDKQMGIEKIISCHLPTNEDPSLQFPGLFKRYVFKKSTLSNFKFSMFCYPSPHLDKNLTRLS